MHQRSSKSGSRSAPPRRVRRRLLAAAVTVLALLVLAVAGYIVVKRLTRPDPLKPFQIYRSPDAPEYS